MVTQLQRRRGSIEKQRFHRKAEPSDVPRSQRHRHHAPPARLIASILIRLPASDLRLFRRVCKEWRDVISDPAFIKAHMVQGPRAPTHTIVFAHSTEQRPGRAFLLDEQWRLTARFNAGESQVLIGTCNGLLCFHDEIQGVVKVVEPFTGESVAVPVPKESMWSRCAEQYCFGYDAIARQYKIVHKGYQRQLKVFTVGADKDWRTVKIAHASWNEGDPACNGGAVYWSYQDNEHGIFKYAHFDLATEEITSVESRRVDSLPIICHHPWWQRGEPCIIQIRCLVGDGESTGGYWPHNMNAMAYEVDFVNQPAHGRRLPGPQALHRGHLLMQEKNGALYAHRIMSKGVHGLDLGCEKLLNGIGVQSSRRWTAQQDISTFAYVPTVAPAPLALYVGAPLASALGDFHVPPSQKLHNVKQE